MRKIYFILFVLGLLRSAGPVWSADRYVFIVEKQQTKARNRWSLSEWLETRDKLRLMDLWLVIHSPSPYEFYFGGNYQTGSQTNGYYNGYEINVGAFASLFGVSADRLFTQPVNRWNIRGNLRIFGFHEQGTNITLHGGVRLEDRSVGQIVNPLLGISSALYLNRFFGVTFLFQHAFSSKGVVSDRYQGGALLDFSLVQLYGHFFQENESGVSPSTRQGGIFGVRAFL